MVKKRNLRGVLYSAVTILLLLSASVAHAVVIVDASCQARFIDWASLYYDNNGDNNINRASYCTPIVSSPLSGTISESVRETLPNPNSIFVPVTRASYVARGDNGNLGVRVDTWAATPSTNPYWFVADAFVRVSLTANDRIAVTSTTLATGASATIDVSGYLEGRAFGNILHNNDYGNTAGSYSLVQGGVHIYELTSIGSIRARAGWAGCFDFNSSFPLCNPVGDFFEAYSQMLEVQVGSTLVIDSYLHAFSQSHVQPIGGFMALEGRSEADAMNTFSTYLTPVTEGVQLLAESGHDYSVPTAVPEPGTWSLMLFGLVLIGAAATNKWGHTSV